MVTFLVALTLGIDISKATLDVALFYGTSYRCAQFANNKKGCRALRKWLKKHKALGCHVCIEATGRYGDAVAQFLHERQFIVSVVNPARIKAYRDSQLKRNKTDREDAKVIAHFCATQQPAAWSPPPVHIEELRALTRRLHALKDDRTRERNRLQSGLRSDAVKQDIQAHLAFLAQQIKSIKRQIDDLIDNNSQLRHKKELLTSIAGIGDITAADFLAEVPDVNEFDSASQLAAYAGLTPSHHSSGSSVYKRSRMSKMGRKQLRKMFYMPARTARRCNKIVQNLVARLEKKGKPASTIRGAVMRKMLHLAYGVLKTGQPFDPNFVNVQNTA